MLYRLRELEEDAFVRISHTLELGPIDYQRRVSGQISVSYLARFLPVIVAYRLVVPHHQYLLSSNGHDRGSAGSMHC